MQLRPHHLLCMQKFTGHGYSPAFTAHLTEMLHTLRANPETAVTLICGCDDLCRACPHNQNGICRAREKTDGLDAGVLAETGLSAGTTGTWASLAAAARGILQTQAFSKICACCDWYSLCRETEASYDENNCITAKNQNR